MNLLEHFDFDINPFVDAVNPAFFFQTRAHEKTLLRTLHCIEDRRALGLVYGRAGTGKTLVSQMLLRRLDRERFEPVVLLCVPQMSVNGMLRSIVGELEEPGSIPARSCELLDHIEQRIMQEYSQGRRIVLLVDEAHFLPSDCLHLLRTLTNLETTTEKLLTTVLFAESIFLRRLSHPRYTSLRGRIAIETEIPVLSFEETEQYLKFRLLVAGGQTDLFTPECYPLMYELSGGVPREINRVADNALLEAFTLGRRIIEPEIIVNAVPLVEKS